MDREDLNALNRARVTAGWSYLGAIIPLFGWILGAISLSNLGSIESPESTKAQRRIQSVKRMAFGGILLSTIVALLYGGGTYLNIRHNNQVDKAAAAAKVAAAEKSCEDYVISINNKIFTLNGKYPPSGNAFANTFSFTTDSSSCKKDADGTRAKADSNLASAETAAGARCQSAAQDAYNNNLKLNGTPTGAKDANGQPVYSLSQANSARIQEQYQSDQNSCKTEFPS